MSISSRFSGKVAEIIIPEKFDISVRSQFRESYEKALEGGYKQIHLNLSSVDYLDSAALGMMLLLQEKAKTKGVEFEIVGTSANAKKVLEVANFSKLFNVR